MATLQVDLPYTAPSTLQVDLPSTRMGEPSQGPGCVDEGGWSAGAEVLVVSVSFSFGLWGLGFVRFTSASAVGGLGF